jgi:hypothetical protein
MTLAIIACGAAVYAITEWQAIMIQRALRDPQR